MSDWWPLAECPADHVLFYGSTLHDADVVFSGWKAKNGRFYSDGGVICKPTHWMPLPEPPTE